MTSTALDNWTAVRRFSMADQISFARLSGDRNPIHLDELAARRTEAGNVAVHGIHLVLWALEALAPVIDHASLAAIDCDFSSFVRPSEDVTLAVRRRRDSKLRLEASVGGHRNMVLTLTFGPAGPSAVIDDLPDIAIDDEPLSPSFDDMATFAGWLRPSFTNTDVEAAFPLLCRALGAQRIAAIALLSSLVGMICPGLHSIFSGLSIKLLERMDGKPGIGVRTKSVDQRFRLVRMTVAGSGIAGELSAFERFPPVDTSLARVRSLVTQGEFATRTALIVGGSRGLGAATAKLIAAGGGRVVLTYFRGAPEAEQIRAELIGAFGEPTCRAMQMDAARPELSDIDRVKDEITHLYYFATPPIARRGNRLFDRGIFDEFMEIYVKGFLDLVELLTADKKQSALTVFYPSSIFVDHRSKNMTEYAMAKAAAEVLLKDLAAARPGLAVMAPRLPRILTDQTASVPPVPTEDAVETLLPLLRAQETAG